MEILVYIFRFQICQQFLKSTKASFPSIDAFEERVINVLLIFDELFFLGDRSRYGLEIRRK